MKLKTSVASKSRDIRPWLGLGVVVVLAVIPFTAGRFTIFLAAEAMTLAILALSFGFLFTYGGYLSFGQAGFHGVGAYAVALTAVHITGSFWVTLPMAIVASGIAALIVGFFCVRLAFQPRGRIYFALLTFAFSQMIHAIIFQWRSFTRGDDGITVRRPTLDFGFFELRLTAVDRYYFLILVVFVAVVLVLWRIVHSEFGYTLRGIRDNTDRAAYVGLDVRRHALIAFVIAGMVAGVAGALRAPLTSIADPGMAYWTSSLDAILATLIGGVLSFSGPIIGAFVFTFVRAHAMAQDVNWPLILGGALLVLALFFHRGIAGFISKRLRIDL